MTFFIGTELIILICMTTTDHTLGHFEHIDLKSSLKLRLSTHFGVILSSSSTLPSTRSQHASNLAVFSDSHSWVSKGQQISLSICLHIKDTRIGKQEIEGFCNIIAKILAQAEVRRHFELDAHMLMRSSFGLNWGLNVTSSPWQHHLARRRPSTFVSLYILTMTFAGTLTILIEQDRYQMRLCHPVYPQFASMASLSIWACLLGPFMFGQPVLMSHYLIHPTLRRRGDIGRTTSHYLDSRSS